MATRKTLNKQLSEGKITQLAFDEGMKELRAKAKERRGDRRATWKAAMLEIKAALRKDVKLSEDAQHLIDLLTGDPRATVTVSCQKGDKLMDLLAKYQDVKDCYGKLARYCEKNGLKIDMSTATIVEDKSTKAKAKESK
jgi:hypothetical protein